MKRERIDEHLERYIDNRNKRMGQTWRVVERYAMFGDGQRCAVDAPYAWYQRAIIENEHDERLRIWYRDSYWTVS